jgi:integrase
MLVKKKVYAMFSMCLICYSCFLRFSELVNLRRSDITFFPTYIKLFLVKDKTDVYREGVQTIFFQNIWCDWFFLSDHVTYLPVSSLTYKVNKIRLTRVLQPSTFFSSFYWWNMELYRWFYRWRRDFCLEKKIAWVLSGLSWIKHMLTPYRKKWRHSGTPSSCLIHERPDNTQAIFFSRQKSLLHL